MKLAATACLLAACFCLTSSEDHGRTRFDGDKVLVFPAADVSEWIHVLTVLKQHIAVEDLDIWKEPLTTTQSGYVRIQRAYWSAVEHALHAEHIQFTVITEDVQKLYSQSWAAVSSEKRPDGKLDISGTFPTYNELQTWMNDLATQYPQIASTYSIGNTYEGRSMQVLQLGLPGSDKWKVWLDAGLHAREWLAVTTAVYVADQLVQGWVNSDAEIISFLEKLEFHILPSGNPDGYNYTWTTDRTWRKNRRPDTVNGSGCIGVDLNRNFGFQWGGANSDPDPCSTMFMGPSPESEIEVQNIVYHILPQAATYIMYHSYHTWGEQFFTRWDYTADEVPPDHDELLALAWKAVDAINAVNNQFYEAGTAPTIMYPFAGSSSDWSRGVAQIKYPYLQELRDDNGTYAFYAPPQEIIPCGEENWAGFLVLLREIMANYGSVNPPSS